MKEWILLSLVFLCGLLFVQSLRTERLSNIRNWQRSPLAYHAVREAYAFVSKRSDGSQSRFNLGHLVSSRDEWNEDSPARSRYTEHAQHSQHHGAAGRGKAANHIVRLLVIDSIPGSILEKHSGPSLHITLKLQGDIYISCRSPASDIQVTTVHTGSKKQVNNLHTIVTYNRAVNRLTVVVESNSKKKDNNPGTLFSSIFGQHSDVTIELPCRRFWPGKSYVTFQKPNGYVHISEAKNATVDSASMATHCIPKRKIIVKAPAFQMCPHKCEHRCNAVTRQCECRTGYVSGIAHPGRCLLTALVEMDVPGLSVELSYSLYSTKNLGALFCLSLTQHLHISDQEIKDVDIGKDRINILLVEKEVAFKSRTFQLEKLASRVIDMARRQEIVFDLFDFDMPPVTNAREIYPSASGRYQKPDVESTALFAMELSKRDAVDDAVLQDNQPSLTKSALEAIHPTKVNMRALAQATRRSLINELRLLVPSFNIDSIKLPNHVSLANMDLKVSRAEHTETGVQLCANVPKKYEAKFTVSKLQLTNLTLCIDLYIVTDMFVRQVKTSMSTSLVLPSATLQGSISLAINGTSTAVLHLHARQLKVFELLTPVLGEKVSKLLRSNGFMDMSVDYVSLDLVYGRQSPLLAIFHIEISSMANFAKVLFESSGTISRISSAIKLDKIFSKFDIKNINATVILKAGKVSFSFLGRPTIPTLSLSTGMELALGNIGAMKQSFRALKLGIPKMSFVDILSIFVPSLKSLKSIKGIGQLQLPEFEFSMTSGLPLNFPDVKLLEFNYPNMSLMNLLPSSPGISFITQLMLKLKRGEKSSANTTLIGHFFAGGFSLEPFKKIKFRNMPLSLELLVNTFFPTFNISSVRLPSSLGGFLKASIQRFAIDSKAKLASFTANIGALNLLKGIWPRSKAAISRVTLLSISLGYKSKPYSWNFNATCVGSFFKMPGKAFVTKFDQSFQFKFNLQKLGISSLVGQIPGVQHLTSLLKRFQMFSLEIKRPTIKLLTKPLTIGADGSLSIGGLPSISCNIYGTSLFTSKAVYVFGMEMSRSVSFSTLVKAFLKIDISGIPFFGDWKLPRLKLLLMPKRLNLSGLELFDTGLTRLAEMAKPSLRSLLASIPMHFPKIGLYDFPTAMCGLQIDFNTGNATLSVTDLLSKILPSGKLMTRLPSMFGSLDKLYVMRFLLKWKSREFAVHAKLQKSITIAKNVISISNIDIRLSYIGKIFNFSFAADAMLMDSLHLRLNVSKFGSMLAGSISSVKPIKIGDLFAKSSAAQTLSALHLSDLVISDFQCSVQMTSSMKFEKLSIDGRATIPNVGSANMTALVWKQNATKLFFAFCLGQTNVASLAKSFTGQDVSSVPLVGKLSVGKLLVYVATSDMSLSTGRLHACGAYLNQTKFQQGFTFSMNFSDQGHQTEILLSFVGGNLLVSVKELSLLTVIRMFFPSFTAASVRLPNGFPQIDKMTVSRIYFDSQRKKASFAVHVGSFKLPKNILTCKHIILDLKVDYSRKPTNYSFKAGCQGTFLSSNVDFALEMAGKTAHFHTTLKSISLYDLLSHGKLADSSFLRFLAKFNLLNITMYNTTIDMKTNPSELAFLGHIQLGTVKGVTLELIAKNAFNKATRVMTMGLVVPEINLSQIVAYLFKMAGFSAFPSIGNVVLDEVRLLALPTMNRSLDKLRFVDVKLNTLLGIAGRIQPISKVNNSGTQQPKVPMTPSHTMVTNLHNVMLTPSALHAGTVTATPQIKPQPEPQQTPPPQIKPPHKPQQPPPPQIKPQPKPQQPPPSQTTPQHKLQRPAPTSPALKTGQQQASRKPLALGWFDRRRRRRKRSPRLVKALSNSIAGMLSIKFPHLQTALDISSALSSRRIDFNPTPNTLSIADLIEKFFSKSIMQSLHLPDFMPALQKVFVNRFLVDFAKKQFLAKFAIPGSISMIKNYVTLSNVKADLEYINKTFNFNFSASAQVAKVVEFSASFSKVGPHYQLTGRIPDLRVGKMLASIPKLGHIFKQMGIADFTIKKAGLDVIWNGTKSSISLFGSPTMTHFEAAETQVTVLDIGKMGNSAFFLGFAIKKGNLSTLVKSLSTVDISQLPRMGSLQLPEMAVWISSKSMRIGDELKLYSDNKIYSGMKKIERGAHFIYNADMGGRTVLMAMGVSLKMVDVHLPEGVSLHQILAYMVPSVTQDSTYKTFDRLFGFIFRLQVKYVLYDAKQSRSTIIGKIPQSLSFFKGKIKLTKAEYNASLIKNHQFSMALIGEMVLFKIPFQAEVKYSTKHSELLFKLETEKTLKLIDLTNAISKKIGQNKFVKKLQLDRFAIKKPSAELIKSPDGLATQLAGQPTIPLFGKYDAEFILTTSPTLYVLILSRHDTSFTDIFHSMTGIDLSKLFFFHLFSGPADIALTYSNAGKDQKLPFKIKTYPFEQETKVIPEGLCLYFEIGLPKCGSDKLCALFHKLFGDKKFKLEIENLGHEPNIKMEAPIGGHLKIAGFDLHDIRFGVEFGTTLQFGLTHAELDVSFDKNNKFKFIGDLTTDPAMNVEMSFQMVGMWQKAFGIPFLAFGNIILRVRVNADCPICISAGEYGGELWLGYHCRINDNKTTCIMGRGYFGFDAEKPEKNYCFFSVNQFSYAKLLAAVGVPKLPDAFEKILSYWEMEDVLFSYSLLFRDVPHGNTTQPIPAGLILRGKFTFLWAAKVNINVRVYAFNGVPTAIFGTVWTNPITLLNSVHLTASNDTKKGAIFSLKAGVVPPAFHVSLTAKLTIPALKVVVNVLGNITTKGIAFHFDAKLIIFDVVLDLSAQFKKALNPKTFQGFMMKGTVRATGLKFLAGKVKEACETARRKAEEHLHKVEKVLDTIEKAVKSAIANKEAAEKVKKGREAAVKTAKAGVDTAEHAISKLCSIHSCKKCGVPKLCMKKKCSCAVKYPCGWGKICCKDVCVPYPSFCGSMCLPVDPKCLAQNAVCAPLRGAAYAAKKTAEGSLGAANKALDTAQKGYLAAAAAVAKYNPALLAARAAVKAAKEAVNQILGILKAFSFTVDRIAFQMALGVAKKGFMEAKLDITASGQKAHLSFRINLKNIMETAWMLAKKFFTKIFDLLKKLKISI
ncbi:uncharacterized protein LOC135809719 [Sycon ciliatum]|uniref:uncharacterized protein LOC135809719 n=1 Tax=Sycon ciliatum TaxID=27933 RepID=UPI0031F68C83